MITSDESRIECITYATADKMADVVRHVDNQLQNSTDCESDDWDSKTSRIADDLNEEYQGWWGENRYKITIVVEKI